VEAAVAQRLVALNKEFYQSHAAAFSATREWVQPGVRRVLESVAADAKILDLGCGNGNVAAELAKQGFAGSYTGVDFSEGLLQAATKRAGGENIRFLQADLTKLDENAFEERPFGLIFSFATLHHIPSRDLRLNFLGRVPSLLADSGCFVLSNWLFLNSRRLVARIQPWEAAGLTTGEVDPGDYLLDWRSGEHGLRYVHAFDEAELAELAEASGFSVQDSFLSDGHGGKLSLYQSWTKKN
jgi:SAM-dependent methyltransferase